jgi:hypothetical protein
MNLNDSEDAYNQVYADEPHHKSHWTHELVAAAAGFAGKSRLRYILPLQYKDCLLKQSTIIGTM